MSTFKIEKIGIEFEALVPRGFQWAETTAKLLAENFCKDTEFVIDVDREYYDNQIEFKLRATDKIEDGIRFFQEFIHSIYGEFSQFSSHTRNHYVGTHIHMFLSKDGKPYSEFAQGKKIRLVEYAYCNMARYIMSMSGAGMSDRCIQDEAERLTRNHNILRYFDAEIGNVLKNNLEGRNTHYQQFHSGTDRPKYTPVLWSLANATSGKPHSLEIRCIPNSFLITQPSESIRDYIMGVEDVLNAKTKRTETDDDRIKNIQSHHLDLLKIIT